MFSSSSVKLGILRMMPLQPSIVLFGTFFGIIGFEANFSLFLTSATSYLIFAGASQVIVLVLLSEGELFFSVIFAGIFINARHVLYGAVMRRYITAKGIRRIILAYLLTDEAFLVTYLFIQEYNIPTNEKYENDDNERSLNSPSSSSSQDMKSSDATVNEELSSTAINNTSATIDKDLTEIDINSFLFGAGIALWVPWNIFTILGYLSANFLPLSDFSTNFVVAGSFLGYLVISWRRSPKEQKFLFTMLIIAFSLSFFLSGSNLLLLLLLLGILISISFYKIDSRRSDPESNGDEK